MMDEESMGIDVPDRGYDFKNKFLPRPKEAFTKPVISFAQSLDFTALLVLENIRPR